MEQVLEEFGISVVLLMLGAGILNGFSELLQKLLEVI